MKKQEFLDRLTRALSGLPYARRQEIIDEFARKFNGQLDAGMAEEEICASFGSPEDYARPFLGTAAPNPQYAYAPYTAAPAYAPGVRREDKTGYIVGLVLTIIFLAVPVIPTALGGIFMGVLVFLFAFLFFPISGMAVFGAFLISLGIFILALSALAIYGIVILLIYLIRGVIGKDRQKEVHAA